MSYSNVTIITAPNEAHFQRLKEMLQKEFNGRAFDGPLGINEKYKFATLRGHVSAAEKSGLEKSGFTVAYDKLGIL